MAATTIALLRAKDSAVVKFSATKNNGEYQVNGVGAGSYLLRFTHVGYHPIYLPFIFSGEDIQVPLQTMQPVSYTHLSITVQAMKHWFGNCAACL